MRISARKRIFPYVIWCERGSTRGAIVVAVTRGDEANALRCWLLIRTHPRARRRGEDSCGDELRGLRCRPRPHFRAGPGSGSRRTRWGPGRGSHRGGVVAMAVPSIMTRATTANRAAPGRPGDGGAAHTRGWRRRRPRRPPRSRRESGPAGLRHRPWQCPWQSP